ncbi:MAG: YjzC family protein [Chloroflexi bacterium]|nr:YjzC family protein [Chloroflexota bacterium]
MAKTHKPGEKAPQSGIWKPTAGGTKVAISKGDRFPPTAKGGSWVPDQLIAKAKPPAKKSR